MSTEEQQARARVVAEARRWLGTPYHHHARIKGVGADCAQLPLAVYAAVGIIPETDVGAYSEQWHHHRSAELYIGWLARFAAEIDPARSGPGDFLIWRFGRTFSHGAIVIEPPMVIHASAGDECVAIADITRDADLPGREMRCFSPWAK